MKENPRSGTLEESYKFFNQFLILVIVGKWKRRNLPSGLLR